MPTGSSGGDWATVLRYSSAALMSPSTYAETSRSRSELKAPGSSKGGCQERSR